MKVLVDTSVWSLAFRRHEIIQENRKILDSLSGLILDMKVVMIGPVRQEILSGMPDMNTYKSLKEKLAAFTDHPVRTGDYETAAYFFNLCRNKGIQGSHIDFLICSVGYNNNFPIFTLDKDFGNYKNHIPIKLYEI